jgi:hypothetical protein
MKKENFRVNPTIDLDIGYTQRRGTFRQGKALFLTYRPVPVRVNPLDLSLTSQKCTVYCRCVRLKGSDSRLRITV